MWTESCFIGESHLNIGEEIFDIQHERLSNDDKAGGVDNATLKDILSQKKNTFGRRSVRWSRQDRTRLLRCWRSPMEDLSQLCLLYCWFFFFQGPLILVWNKLHCIKFNFKVSFNYRENKKRKKEIIFVQISAFTKGWFVGDNVNLVYW